MREVFAFAIAFLCIVSLNAQSNPVVTITGDITSDRFFDKDTTYLLNGYVSVINGAVLTIEAGTVVKGGKAENLPANNTASALIIDTDSRLIANGSAQEPIIFTAEDDDTDVVDDIDQFATGLWGGVIILGDATLNSPAGGSDLIEGIDPNSGAPRAFGGTNDNHNGGILRYISIRHGGAELAPNDEINGLTLGGVGAATTLEFIEVYANDDDGIEFFGGTASVKYAAVAFCSDDSFDYDQGWNGKGQYWFTLTANGAGSNRPGEHDGATSPESAQPFTIPEICNATYFGKGIAPEGEPEIIFFRDNAGGKYGNNIFCESNSGVRVELNFNEPLTSNTQLNAGNLFVRNTTFGGGTLFIPSIALNISPANQVADTDPDFPLQNNQLNLARRVGTQLFNASNNQLLPACPVESIDFANLVFHPKPTGSIEAAGNDVCTDPFFDQVTYRGAFDPNATTWLAGWSHLSERGFVSE